MALTNRQKGLTLRDEQRNFTRARLIECAAEVISERGLANATIGDITSRANTSRATFYLHFKDKDDLLAAIMDEVGFDVALYYTRFDEAIAARDRGQFRAWLVDALQWFHDHDSTIKAIEYAGLANGARLPGSMFTAHMPTYTGWWPADGRREAEMRVWLVVQMILRIHFLGHRSSGFGDMSDDEMIDVLAAIAWQTLLLDTIPPSCIDELR